MSDKFYITTAIPYVNGKPHIGHALEYFQADVLRRYHQMLGEETLLLSGADENALKNVQAAEKEGVPVKDFLDRNSKVFRDSYEFLGVHLDVFQRGSDQEKHWPGVQKLWNLCMASGDIYKKTYEGLYCVGCESFKTEKELINGECPDHNKKPEVVKEENYFFKLSKYQNKLLELIETGAFKIAPENKRAEIVSFIRSGLEDFSVSRSKERARGVGVPVPDDENQVIYVWFDALDIYMTGVGFGWDEETWKKWWPADMHVIGKDINRFHTVYWPAMLLSAGIDLPKQVLVHSFVTSKGQKMSKSIGNVIDPYEMVNKYGLEAVRYYMLSRIPLTDDGDFTEEKFVEVYNADLANGLGNLTSRVAKLCENAQITMDVVSRTTAGVINKFVLWIPDPGLENEYLKGLESYRFNETLGLIWQKISELDRKIEEIKPWEQKIDDDAKFLKDIAVLWIRDIARLLGPFLPETAEKILKQFAGPKIKSAPPLFPRIK